MLNRDFSDMLKTLNENNVEYLLVGAYALAAMGKPRATGDLDIFVRASSENAKKLMSALRTFGAPLADVTLADFETPGVVFQIGVPPVRIDILTELTGITFEEAWRTRTELLLSDLTIPVLGKDAFIKNKKALGRHKDLADIELIDGSE